MAWAMSEMPRGPEARITPRKAACRVPPLAGFVEALKNLQGGAVSAFCQ
jgi:hypothetical protein